MMLKEQLIRFLNSLADILYCLRANKLPERITLSQLGNVFLKFCTIQVLTPHPVVPSMKGDAMVIDNSGSVNCLLKISIPLVVVQFKLQCFHEDNDSMNCR